MVIERFRHWIGSLGNRRKEIKETQKLLEKKIAELQEKEGLLNQAKTTISELDEKSSFVASIINAQPQPNMYVSEYKEILDKDYLNYANNNDSLAEEASSLKRLQKVQSQLEIITNDKQLVGKTIIAIAGAFSSGKSSFMNSLFVSDKTKLPIGMDQTTAIATYIMNGEKSEIIGYSYNNGRIEISEKFFSLFTHNKEDGFKFNMKRIVDKVIFNTEFISPYENICFIDTPGFNPGNNSQMDYDTALSAISTAQAVLWCFDISQGTLRTDELQILQDIKTSNPDIKIYIIANRADLKSIEDCEMIISETEIILDSNFIEYDGISLYTSTEKFNCQLEDFSPITRKKQLSEFLSENNVKNTTKEKELLHDVKSVFDDYIDADNARIKKIETQLSALNAIENSFNLIVDDKDDKIAYHKARMSKKYNTKTKKNNTDTFSYDDSEYLESSEDILDTNFTNIYRLLGKLYETNTNIRDSKTSKIPKVSKNSKTSKTSKASKNLKTDFPEFDSDEEMNKISDAFANLKFDLQETIKKDKNDILVAKELCKKFSKCISKAFKVPASGD